MINFLIKVALIIAGAVVLLSVMKGISIQESISTYVEAFKELWEVFRSIIQRG